MLFTFLYVPIILEKSNIVSPTFNILPKYRIMFYEQKRRPVCLYQLFDLYPRKYINKVERFIPDIQVRPLTQTPRDQYRYYFTCFS